ncbi:Mitochondrial ribosome-associated GTPase 1 [Echinococcus granulosus]|nr:Mitochondrial ribosome-associated GTPase 1 [Echinococcus granulosus]
MVLTCGPRFIDSIRRPFIAIRQCSHLFYTSVPHLNYVRHVLPNSINWYPGHIRKGLKDITSRLAEVDIVIELHDARIPLTGRCQFVREAGQIRPHVLVMTKTDLSEPINDFTKHKELISEDPSFGPLDQPPAEIFFTNLKHPERQKRLLRRILTRLAELAPRWSDPSSSFVHEFADDISEDEAPSSVQRYINAIVVGLPNCGKSSLINALRSFAPSTRRRRAAVRVGKNAGMTRSVGGPVVIARDFPVVTADGTTRELCTLRLIDTPGILEPKAQTLCGQLSLGVCGAMDWNAVDKILLADYLLFCLNAHSNYQYVVTFGLPEPTRRVDKLLAWVAARRHLIQPLHHQNRLLAEEVGESFQPKSVGDPDFDAAAVHFLRAFNEGTLGRLTILPADEARAEPWFVPTTSSSLYKSNK